MTNDATSEQMRLFENEDLLFYEGNESASLSRVDDFDDGDLVHRTQFYSLDSAQTFEPENENILAEKILQDELYHGQSDGTSGTDHHIDLVINNVIERGNWLEYDAEQNFLLGENGEYVELHDCDVVDSNDDKLNASSQKLPHRRNGIYVDVSNQKFLHGHDDGFAVNSSVMSDDQAPHDFHSFSNMRVASLNGDEENYSNVAELSVYQNNNDRIYSSNDVGSLDSRNLKLIDEKLYYGGHSNDASSSANYRLCKRGPTTKICEYCGLFLRHPSKIAAHMRTHTGERPFTCEYCGQDFSQRTPYRMHVKRHVGDLPFSCSFCAKKFPSNASRNGHEIRVHHKLKRQGQPQPHLKPAQNFVEKREIELTKSRSPIVNWQPPVGELRKPISDTAMRRISNIVEFVAAGIHKNIVTSSSSLSASTSQSSTQPVSSIRRYEDRHPPTVAQCADCGLIFKHPSKIQAHMRTHTGEKPFRCRECGLGCSTNSALRVHIRRFHTGERPHECTWECGKRFVSVAARNEHERIVHAGIKRYQCTIGDCRRLFTRRSYMVKHLQTHSSASAELFNEKRPITEAFKRLQTEGRPMPRQKPEIDYSFVEETVNNSRLISNYNINGGQFGRKTGNLGASSSSAMHQDELDATSANSQSQQQQHEQGNSAETSYLDYDAYNQHSMNMQLIDNEDSAVYYECDDSGELPLAQYDGDEYGFGVESDLLKDQCFDERSANDDLHYDTQYVRFVAVNDDEHKFSEVT